MLIVSKVLLARRNEHGAWQLDENKKRTPDDYVVVKGDDLTTVEQSVTCRAGSRGPGVRTRSIRSCRFLAHIKSSL